MRAEGRKRTSVGSMLQKFVSRLRDYAELTKARITTLIVLTAWCGYFFGAHQLGVSSWSLGLVHALLGVALVSSGTAALNEVLESSVDARMRRTAQRPVPSGRMTKAHAAAVGLALTLGGSAYLAIYANLLTGLLVFLTSLVYLAAYTPLKKVSPVCTFVGAFPGAMPVVLGWTAVRGKLEVETLILFAIMFVWQFPHFLSIAWLYREDYAQGDIRMLPVVESDGKSTVWRILAYSGSIDSGERFTGRVGNGGTRVFGWRHPDGRGAVPCVDGNGVSAIAGNGARVQTVGSAFAAGDDYLSTCIVRAHDG